MKNRLIQFLPVLLIAFVSFATLGIVQAQNRNPCADTPDAERLLSELTTACSEQSSEKIEKFIEKWEQESRTAAIYDTNDKLTTTVYQLLDYLMEKYYFNNKELSPDKQGRIVNAAGNIVWEYKRTWGEKKYLRPIPQTAITRNPNLEQNALWK